MYFRRKPVSVLVALALYPFSQSTMADTDDAWNVYAGVTTYFDNNLFRRDSGSEIDDQILSTYVGANVDKTWSRQRLRLNATLSDNQYKYNDQLDYPGKDLDLTWSWGITSRIRGEVTADYSETINSFVDFSSTTKNIRTTEGYGLELDWKILGRWWLITEGSFYEQENSAIFLAESDFSTESLDLGIKYETPKGNHINLVHRTSDGEYDNRAVNPVALIDSGFDQERTEFQWLWQFGGHTALTGTLGYLERTHDHYSERDFEGPVGGLNLRWQASGAVQFDVSVKQNLVSYQSSPITDINLIVRGDAFYNSSYYTLRSVEIAPHWQISHRIGANMRLAREHREYAGGLIPYDGPFSAFSDRDDKLNTYSLGFYWSPIDLLRLDLSLRHEDRQSNRIRADFDADIAMLRLSLNI